MHLGAIQLRTVGFWQWVQRRRGELIEGNEDVLNEVRTIVVPLPHPITKVPRAPRLKARHYFFSPQTLHFHARLYPLGERTARGRATPLKRILAGSISQMIVVVCLEAARRGKSVEEEK